MGTKYSANSVSGYNATPPADDGTVSEANKVKWSTIKTKLPDPLKTTIEAVDSDLQTHFDHGPTALTSNTTLGATHYEKFIQVSGAAVTLTLSDAATLTAGWNLWIVNTDSSNAVTIGRATGADTINGSAANFTLPALHAIQVFVIAAATGFAIRSWVINPVTTDTAQTITGAKTFDATTTVRSTDAGAGAGPFFDLNRDSASPAVNDAIGVIRWLADDSGGNSTEYASLLGGILDPTDTSEDGQLRIRTTVAGTAADRLIARAGVQIGSPTGADKGAGTLNAETNIYVNNVPVVTETGTQTLTNKTLTSPTVNTPTITGATIDVASGVAFPATQVPSADANTLDDYEEGTWTPSVGGTATYTTQSGTYTKIGRLVFITCILDINTIGTGSTTTISGVPFTASIPQPLPIRVTTGSATAIVSAIAEVSTTSIAIKSRTAAATADGANGIFGDGTQVEIAGCYF